MDLVEAYAKKIREEQRLNSNKEHEAQNIVEGLATNKDQVESSNTPHPQRGTQ